MNSNTIFSGAMLVLAAVIAYAVIQAVNVTVALQYALSMPH